MGNAGYLTTHVLDTARGLPADGVAISLYRIDGAERTLLAAAVTNADGRTDRPILDQAAFGAGVYELLFRVGAYLDRAAPAGGALRFLGDVPIRFGVDDPDRHYHVPLLVSPFGYSTYRGS
ncbi:MAG: hydroxyisourate hydrolase [Alphaproteobacteria bacterium]